MGRTQFGLVQTQQPERVAESSSFYFLSFVMWPWQTMIFSGQASLWEMQEWVSKTRLLNFLDFERRLFSTAITEIKGYKLTMKSVLLTRGDCPQETCDNIWRCFVVVITLVGRGPEPLTITRQTPQDKEFSGLKCQQCQGWQSMNQTNEKKK